MKMPGMDFEQILEVICGAVASVLGEAAADRITESEGDICWSDILDDEDHVYQIVELVAAGVGGLTDTISAKMAGSIYTACLEEDVKERVRSLMATPAETADWLKERINI